MENDVVLKFLGGGHMPGVPARDLSQADWDGLTPGEQAAALNCGLYEAVGGKKKAAELATQAEQVQAAQPAEESGK